MADIKGKHRRCRRRTTLHSSMGDFMNLQCKFYTIECATKCVRVEFVSPEALRAYHARKAFVFGRR